MYRPTASALFARNYAQILVAAGTNALSFAADALKGAMEFAGIYEQAMRENRQRSRATKRHNYYIRNAAAGLNGKRAVARRLRQIQAGSLRFENGLVSP